MKNKKVIVLTISLICLIIFPTFVNGFGDHDKENIYQSSESGFGFVNTGVRNIDKCKDYEMKLKIWNDPLGLLTNVKTEVTLPKTFSNSGNYDSKAINTATSNSGVIVEEDVDNIAWLVGANGLGFTYIPNTSVYYFNSSMIALPDPVIEFVGNEQKIKFNNLINLNDNESIQVAFKMRVGGNCLSADKKLVSESRIYQAGEKVIYEMNLVNSGKYRYKDIKISDTFDTNAYSNILNDITVESLDGRSISNKSVNNNVLSFDLSGVLLSNANTKVKLTFTVKNAYTTNQACNISASVNFKDGFDLFTNTTNFTYFNSLCVPLKTNPSLSVLKKLSGVQQSGKVSFDIEIKNTGDTLLTNILVKDFYDANVLELESSIPAFTYNQGGEFRVSYPNLNPNDTGVIKATFKIKNLDVAVRACNNSIVVTSMTNNQIEVNSNWSGPLCIDYVPSVAKIKVIKYLTSASLTELVYKVEISNIGNTTIKTLSFVDEFDKSRLVLDSTNPIFTSNENGVININELLTQGKVLLPNEKLLVSLKFKILEKAPVGLACNLTASATGKDNDNRNVYDKYIVEKNTQNCINLTIINETDPYFSIVKKLSSKSDALVNEVVTWEVIARNICNNDNCNTADRLELKESFPADKLYFNSIFAQLKNADGTNVNANPIQFTPTSNSIENGQAIIRHNDLTEVVGNISKGQYIVLTIFTSAKAVSSSCVLNTATVVGPANSVSASACVNIGEIKGTTDVVIKDKLPSTDILDIFNMFNILPNGMKLALSIALISILSGIAFPTLLLLKSKKYD